MQRQREFLRDTSHAIRTPVTIARGHVELLRLTSDDPGSARDTDEVLHQLNRLGELAGRLLVMETLDTTGGLRRDPSTSPTSWPASGRAGGRPSTGAGWSASPTRVSASSTSTAAGFEEALDAFVENAVRFTTPGAVVRLSARRDGDQVTIEVADSGPGIPAADRAASSTGSTTGTRRARSPAPGLGLALVQSIARAHGGWANAGEAPEGGALLALHLPASAGGEPATRPRT